MRIHSHQDGPFSRSYPKQQNTHNRNNSNFGAARADFERRTQPPTNVNIMSNRKKQKQFKMQYLEDGETMQQH